MIALEATALVMAALGAAGVVMARDPLRQIVMAGLYGLVLSVLFAILQAPDVALSMLVVGTIALPLIVLVSVARVQGRGRGGKA